MAEDDVIGDGVAAVDVQVERAPEPETVADVPQQNDVVAESA